MLKKEEEHFQEVKTAKFEKISTLIHSNSEIGSLYVARKIAELISDKTAKGEYTLLGLATGSFLDFTKGVSDKVLGTVDSTEIQNYKGLIRQEEEKSACRYCGLKEENAYFFNFPFYETGTIRKNPSGEEDVWIVYQMKQCFLAMIHADVGNELKIEIITRYLHIINLVSLHMRSLRLLYNGNPNAK